MCVNGMDIYFSPDGSSSVPGFWVFLNSFMALPIAPPISGNLPTPKIISTTTRTIINSIGPNLNGIVF